MAETGEVSKPRTHADESPCSADLAEQEILNHTTLGHDVDINALTYETIGAVFEVSRILGPGFLEKVYENALLVELRKRGLKAENQIPIKVSYKGHAVGEYVADIIVEDAVLLELWTRPMRHKC